MKTLRINSIESLSTKDGDGTRCVIFLQGCPLRCVYCHNIETWDSCGGEEITVAELTRKVLRYQPYFDDKGGVTVSGGEPLVQAADLLVFLSELKKHNINVALDTGGSILNEDVQKIIALADHIMLDLKFPTEFAYKENTGGRLETTLAFLDECLCQNKRIWIRIVVVPGLNDSKEAMREYINLLEGKTIEKVELLPFHTLGFEKFKKLNIENPLKNTKAMSISKCSELQKFVNNELNRRLA